jgi:hypothetical protein
MPENIIRGYFDRELPPKDEGADDLIEIAVSFDNVLRRAIRANAKQLGFSHTERVIEMELLELCRNLNKR